MSSFKIVLRAAWLAFVVFSSAQTITTSIFLPGSSPNEFSGYLAAETVDSSSTYILHCDNDCRGTASINVTSLSNTISWVDQESKTLFVNECVITTRLSTVFADCEYYYESGDLQSKTLTLSCPRSMTLDSTLHNFFFKTIYITPRGSIAATPEAIATQSSINATPEATAMQSSIHAATTQSSINATPEATAIQSSIDATTTSVAAAALSSSRANSHKTDNTTPGLPTSAKVRIAMGAIAFVLVLILLGVGLYLCLRHRRNCKVSTFDLLPNHPELITSSNTYEIQGDVKKFDATVLPFQETGTHGLESMPTDSTTQARTQQYIPCSVPVHELDEHRVEEETELGQQGRHGTSSPHIKMVELEPPEGFNESLDHRQSIPQPEISVPSSPIPRKVVESPSSLGMDASPNTSETEVQKEERLKLLTERIERIRTDKARLEELQRLSDIEEVIKEEIMAVHRAGPGSN